MEKDATVIGARIYFSASKNRQYRESIRQMLATLADFLQSNGLVTTEVLAPGAPITEDFVIRRSDLSDEGFEFYRRVEEKWLSAIDRGKDPTERSLLEKELRVFRQDV